MAIDLNLLEKISEDRALAVAMLFDHDFKSPPAHVEVMDLWRSRDEFVLIEAFRQFGKSTTAEEHITLEGSFGNFHYLLLIGETYEKACQRLAAIDYEARTNVKLHRVFGGPVLARKSIENKVWFRSGAFIQALGWEQELQSFKEHEHRPDLAWLDDPENLERVRDKAAVDASMRKLYLELIPAMDKQRRRVRITQTRRADDCMVTRIATSGEWIYRAYPICNGDPDDPATRAIWPERYPMDWIRREKRNFEQNGMLREFLQAYMLQARDRESAPFKGDMLKAIDASPWHWMPKVAIYDPARTSHDRRTKEFVKSNRYGKVVVSRMGSQILVHDSSGKHWKPDEMIADVFATNEKYHPAKIAIEKDSLDEWLLQPIRLEMLKRGRTLPLEGINAPHDRSKDDFIMGLQPFAEAGDIVLVGGRVAHPELVAEFENFPQGSRDVINCLAYALRMFAGEPVYPDFSGANIGEAPDARRGETVYVGASANENEMVAVAMLRDGQRLMVARDWGAFGPDAAATIVLELRAAFPLATFQVWAPAELHDQWQRIPLVPKLRAARVTVYRGEHTAPSRGCLSTHIRTEWRQKRLLLVDRAAVLTLNSLMMGYAYPVQRGGGTRGEPAPGTARLVGEAVECVAAMLGRQLETEGIPKGANIGHTPAGMPYVTAHPKR